MPAEPVARAEGGAFPADDAGLELRIEGEGAEAIVMVHGWPDTLRLWDRQVEALRGRFRCVRFTLPGFAGPRRALHSLDELVAAVGRAVDAAGAPATLLLHDWGCLFGYQFALRHPERVRRVIAVDGGDAGSRAFMRETPLRHKLAIVGYQCWLAAAWRIGGGLGDRMARRMARAARAPADPATVSAQMGYPYWVQWTGARGGFRGARAFMPHCPMLFVYGRRKPFMFHSAQWAGEVAARPGCRVLAFDCGHWVMVEQAAEFNAAVLDWLGAP